MMLVSFLYHTIKTFMIKKLTIFCNQFHWNKEEERHQILSNRQRRQKCCPFTLLFHRHLQIIIITAGWTMVRQKVLWRKMMFIWIAITVWNRVVLIVRFTPKKESVSRWKATSFHFILSSVSFSQSCLKRQRMRLMIVLDMKEQMIFHTGIMVRPTNSTGQF